MEDRQDIFEENIKKLLSSAHKSVEPSPVLRERLFPQLIARVESKRKRPWAKAYDAFTSYFYIKPKESIDERTRIRTALLISSMAVVGIVLLGFWIFAFFIRPVTPKQLGIISVQKGQVAVQQAQPTAFRLQRVKRFTLDTGEGAVLCVGDRVTTDEVSSALLTFVGGSTTEVQPGSELTIQDLQLGTKATPSFVIIKLWMGKTLNRVVHLPGLSTHFEIETPSLEVVAQSTVFRVQVISEDHTYVAADEGVIRIRTDEQAVNIRAGEEVDAIVGQSLVVQPQKLRINGGGTTMITRERTTIIEGRGRPNSAIEVIVNGDKVDTIQADAMGDFSYAFTAAEEGEYTISAVAVGLEGAVGEASEPVTILYDRTPPRSLVITSPTESEVLSSPIILAGKTEVGARVTVNGMEVAVDAEGGFSTSLELQVGSNPITVIAADQAGNMITAELVIELK